MSVRASQPPQACDPVYNNEEELGDMAAGSRSRIAFAIAAGFVTTAVLSTGTDAAMQTLGIFPPAGERMSDALFVVATLYRVLFTVLGGYVTAALTPGRAFIPVIILGAIGELAATAGTIATWNAGPEFGPHWYPIALIVTALPCVLAGLVLRRGLPMQQA